MDIVAFTGQAVDAAGTLAAWPVFVFGWPAVVAAMAAFAVGVSQRRPRSIVAGTILAAPFCLDVSGYPAIRGLGLVVLAFTALAALAVRRGRVWLGAGLLVPFAALAGFIATPSSRSAAAARGDAARVSRFAHG